MTPGRPGPRRDGLPMPGEIQEHRSADSLAGNGQPTLLVIGQPVPSVTELFEKDAVFFPEQFARGLLVPFDPAREPIAEVSRYCPPRTGHTNSLLSSLYELTTEPS